MAREPDPTLSRYIVMTRQFPRLTREEEGDLAKRWRDTRDRRAADRLVRAHLRDVVVIALKYRRYNLPLSELIAEGNFGVAHALTKFDPERGTRFVTYASYWIRAFILNHVLRSWSVVGGGAGVFRSKLFFRLRRERVGLTNLFGDGDQVNDLLAEKFGASSEEIAGMLRRLDARDRSLDAKPSPGSISLLDTLKSPHQDQYEVCERSGFQQRLVDSVRRALDALDARERYIAQHRLMADAEEELSLADIGRHLGVSRERARQLEMRTKKKLRVRMSQTLQDPAADLVDTAA